MASYLDKIHKNPSAVLLKNIAKNSPHENARIAIDNENNLWAADGSKFLHTDLGEGREWENMAAHKIVGYVTHHNGDYIVGAWDKGTQLTKPSDHPKLDKLYDSGFINGVDDKTNFMKFAEGGTVYIPHDDPRRAKNLEAFDPVKDESGKPRVFYHNTDRDFKEFHTTRSEMGAHFGTPNQAANLEANQNNPLRGRRTVPVHLSIKNPIRLIDEGDFSPARVAEQLYNKGIIDDDLYDRQMDSDYENDEDAVKDLHRAIRKAGHDGIVYLNRREGLRQHPDPEINKKNMQWLFSMAHRASDDEFLDKFPDAQDSYIAISPNQIKSATGNQGTFDPKNPDITKAEGGTVDLSQYQDSNNFGLYSHAAETAAALPQAKGTPDQFKAMLMKQGVKPVEIENSNYDETFAGRPSVTKDELVQHFRQSMPKITESLYSSAPKYSNYAVGPSQYHTYTLNGGDNYREIVLKKPVKTKRVGILSNGTELSEEELQNPIVRRTAEKVGLRMVDRPEDDEEVFKHQHWRGEVNPIAHIRMSDRTGPNGEKILHVEELQSDWGQRARESGIVDRAAKKAYDEHMREYRALGDRHAQLELQHGVQDLPYKQQIEAVPELKEISDRMAHMYMNEPDKPQGMPYNPYITSTGAWTDLALKRVLHEAAHGGYDKVVWTPGEQQADRFDLSNHVKQLTAEPTKDGKIHLQLHESADPEDPISNTIENIHPDDLHKYVGKEVADRILKQIEFPKEQKVWRIQDKKGGSFRTTTTPDFDLLQEFFDQYPENVRNTLEIVPVMEMQGGRDAYLRGLDLKVGGEGMKGFYDKIVPKQLSALAKKHDPEARVGQTLIDTPQGSVSVHSMDITPKMRDSILRGQKAFAAGGEVDDDGITAYHGSPYDFQRFDLSKIGTGEGAQSYGHGLYFAEAEPTAISYRDRLAKEGPTPGDTIADEFAIDPQWQKTMSQEDIAEHLEDVKRKAEKVFFESGKQKYLFNDGSILTDEGDHFRAGQKEKGHMYEVKINAHPDHFLDWDKPLSEQPEHIQKLAKEFNFVPRFGYKTTQLLKEYQRGEEPPDYKATGMTFHDVLRLHHGGDEGAARYLATNGIKGIKYLDAGSRGVGEGSRNYVVFDDKLVNVKRKYAAGGMVEDENGKDTDENYEKGRHGEARSEGFGTDQGRGSGRSGKLQAGSGGRRPGWASSVKTIEAGPVVDRALMVISRKAKSLR